MARQLSSGTVNWVAAALNRTTDRRSSGGKFMPVPTLELADRGAEGGPPTLEEIDQARVSLGRTGGSERASFSNRIDRGHVNRGVSSGGGFGALPTFEEIDRGRAIRGSSGTGSARGTEIAGGTGGTGGPPTFEEIDLGRASRSDTGGAPTLERRDYGHLASPFAPTGVHGHRVVIDALTDVYQDVSRGSRV